MNNERVTELIDNIEKELRELAEITGEDHISTFLVNNNFHFYTFGENNKLSLNIWRKGETI